MKLGINSDKQNVVYTCVERAPHSLSVEEIARQTGVPKNTVRGSLTKLKARGLVDRASYGWFRVQN